MRISDWSSDVCSSDLIVVLHSSLHSLVANSATLAAAHLTDASTPPPGGTFLRDAEGRLNGVLLETAAFIIHGAMPKPTLDQRLATLDAAQQRYFAHGYTHAQDDATLFGDIAFFTRSEEHTSELQSLMRISYAVFCLKKK